MQRNDRVQAIVLTRKQRGGFQLVQSLTQHCQLRSQLTRNGLTFARELEIGIDVRERAGQPLVSFQCFFQAATCLENFLRGFLVLPEIRAGYPVFDSREFAAFGGGVKENS